MAYYRLTVMIAAWIYVLIPFYLNGYDYFNYLTNWGNFTMAECFTMLVLGHAFYGDFGDSWKTNRFQWWYWKSATFLYEQTMMLMLMVPICFFFIVFPYMVNGPEWVDPRP